MAAQPSVEIINVLDSVQFAGEQFASSLAGWGGLGVNLAFILFGIALAWSIIEGILGSDKNFIASTVKSLMVLVIVLSLITNWAGKESGKEGFLGVSVQEFFTKSIPSLAEEITGKDDNVVTAEVIDSFFKAMGNIVTSTISESNEDKLKEAAAEARANSNELDASFFASPEQREEAKKKADALESELKASGAANVSFGEWVGTYNIIDDFVALLIRLFAAGFLILTLVSFIFMLNVGSIMIYVGLTLGPVLVPFLLITQTSFLFTSWTKFMISASFYKVIAIIIACILIGVEGKPGILNVIVNYTESMATSDESVIFLAMILLFFSILSKHIMDRTDNMASSLASGGPTMGTSNIVNMTAGAAASVSSKPIGSAVGKAANYISGKMKKPGGEGGSVGSSLAKGAAGAVGASMVDGGVSSAASLASKAVRSKIAAARARSGR